MHDALAPIFVSLNKCHLQRECVYTPCWNNKHTCTNILFIDHHGMSDINRFVRFSIDFIIKQIYFQTCYVVLNIMRRLARYVTAAGHAVIFQPLLSLAPSWPPFCLLLIPVRLIAIHDLYWCDFVSHALTNLRQEAIDGQFLSIGNTVLSIQEALLTF